MGQVLINFKLGYDRIYPMLNHFAQKKFSKILVTGGGGTIGSYVTEVFGDCDVILAGRDMLDITMKNQVLEQVKKYKPDVIIHLAAITNVDYCEENELVATKVNFEGTKNITMVCKKYQIPLVYISTATVFDGKNPPNGGYTEDDNPSPVNVYGKTKLLGEKVISKILKNYIIIRIGWLVGGRENDKFFISYMSKKILRGEHISAVNDIFGTIAHAHDMLDFVKEKLSREETGIFHFACKGACSRYDIAVLLKGILNPSIKVNPVSAQSFKKEFPAPRPKYQMLQSKRHSFQRTWKSTLREYIKKTYQ
jgi:dTDP-4-dehydrorhamnose reductase